MALSYPDWAIIESHIGTLTSEGRDDAELRLARLGSAEGVALELLMVRRATLRFNATKVKSADDTLDWTENIKFLNAAIIDLAEYIQSGSGFVNAALTGLVGQALGQSQGVEDLDFGLLVKSSNFRQA